MGSTPAPPRPRDLTRTRKQLTREKAAHAQRIDKLLQAANLRLGTVLADILGASGRAILAALAAGETDPERLADRVQTRIRASRQRVIEALRGRLAEHQRQLPQIHLDQIDAIDRALGALDAALDHSLDPFREAAERLTTIPGVGALAAAGIIAEIGCDMNRFATPAHPISWAGLCPANDESAGKRRSTRLRKGAPPGSRPSSSRSPGAPPVPRPAICPPCSPVCAPAAGRRRRSSRSPPRS